MKRNIVLYFSSVALAMAAGAALAWPATTLAQTNAAHTANQARVDTLNASNHATYSDSSHVLVLPGLIADRETREVRFLAEATGVGANEIIEFMVVGPGSSHDYESLAVSFAKASDLNEALRFVGMPAGRAVNYADLAFWPKGERVIVHVSPLDSPTNNAAAWADPVRIENLIWLKEKGQPMNASGLVFTGSRMVPAPDGGTNMLFAADTTDPRAIISTYNEPQTLLDVPFQAGKGSVYANQIMRESHAMQKNTLLSFVMRPEREHDKPRVLDMTLWVAPDASGGHALSNATFTLRDNKSQPQLGPTNLPAIVTYLAKQQSTAERDPFITLAFSPDMPLAMARHLSQVFSELERRNGLRIEPPLQGHVYYKALIPPEHNREREGRMQQPWELHMLQENGAWHGNLVQIEEDYDATTATSVITPTSYPVTSSEALRQQLNDALRTELRSGIAAQPADDVRATLEKQLEAMAGADLWKAPGEKLFSTIQNALFSAGIQMTLPTKVRQLRVILMYAPNDMTYGDAMAFLKDATTSHPTIHIYLPKTETISSP
ncbi:MAG: hypothetical protein OSB41_00150 [Kiritimatiellae bacterium]|nr:hypothetical protein [Kiritimatiellia bacterium]